MRGIAAAALAIAVALMLSACAGGSSSSAQLPRPLHKFVQSLLTRSAPGDTVNEIDVYGPGSRSALAKASSGDVVTESSSEKRMRFYLVVLHGQFVCNTCGGPPGAKTPTGTVETRIWSAGEGDVDFGIANSLPAAVSSLHRLAVITPS